MADASANDPIKAEAQRCFAELVESVGVKRFAQALNLSTRQINRILAGAQPNQAGARRRTANSGDGLWFLDWPAPPPGWG